MLETSEKNKKECTIYDINSTFKLCGFSNNTTPTKLSDLNPKKARKRIYKSIKLCERLTLGQTKKENE